MLAEDKDFKLRLKVLLIAKNHNLFSEGDRYMRQFARIVYGLKDIGRDDIGDRLQEILNSEISI